MQRKVARWKPRAPSLHRFHENRPFMQAAAIGSRRMRIDNAKAAHDFLRSTLAAAHNLGSPARTSAILLSCGSLAPSAASAEHDGVSCLTLN